MSLHHQLPIYRVTRDLLKKTIQITRNLPRDIKPSLGKTLLDEVAQMTVLILRANVAWKADKVPHLEDLLERLQVVELLFRALTDLKMIPTTHHADVIGLTAEIGKQATGWKKAFAATPDP